MPEQTSQPAPSPSGDLSRYSRQIIFDKMGEAAQARLSAARVTLIGCGALGTVLANTLVRAGVGFLRIVDRDYVEWNNLQRQVLFDESDAAAGAPKAVAAATRLATINSSVTVEPVIADANPGNIESLVEGAHLILDGTDNFEIRFLVNDVSAKHGVPWVYGACVGANGMVMPVLPGESPCLRCVWESPPPPGMNPTCDTAGVLSPIVNVVASLQAMEAIKILTGRLDAVVRKLIQIDAWAVEFEQFDWSAGFEKRDCPCCRHGRYDYLNGVGASRTASLCGRDAVQIAAAPGVTVDFAEIAARIKSVASAQPTFNPYLLRFAVDGFQVTLFKDGRAIIKGTHEPDEARTIYARYIGA